MIDKPLVNYVRLIFLYAFLSVFLFSCEGPVYVDVKVVDKLTQQPLDSVFVEVQVMCKNKERNNYQLSGYTDSTGNFKDNMMVGTGLIPCPIDIRITYNKTGYNNIIKLNRTNGLVELRRL